MELNKRFNFNYNALNKHCLEYNIKLNNDYSKDNLTQKSIISGICYNDTCDNIFLSNLRLLFRHNFTCSDCIKIKQKEKTIKTCLEKYGVINPKQNKEIMDKSKKTCLEKYGCETALENKSIREKRKETCLEKYGCEYALQNKISKEKIKQTCLDKYGCEYGFQNNDIKEKIKQTCLEKYGCENPFQNETIKQNIKKTCLEKYGVEYAMQNDNIASKSSKTSYLFKKYTLPSGKIINIQGYENYALDKIFKDNIKEDDICFIKKEVPIIWYEENNKKHRHYVDFFIKSLNKCIEVKSIWTFEKKKSNVLLKQDASKKLGYLYEIWIFEPNGNLNKIIY